MRLVLLVGTKRGLFIFETDGARRVWKSRGPYLIGREVYHALRDERDGTVWAATDHSVWGAHLHRSNDLGLSWETIEEAPHYPDERGLEAIWFLAPGQASQPKRYYAGIEPAGLFVTRAYCLLLRRTTMRNGRPLGRRITFPDLRRMVIV